jgi:CheY-like chemotaxis protein
MTRVLIVEDNPANMKLATFLLESVGYTVSSATDAEAGLTLARDEHPDLILMDIQLPGMDGYAVARALRALETLRGASIIAVTSYAMVGDREKALAAGCNGYIEKPIDPMTFVDQIALFGRS